MRYNHEGLTLWYGTEDTPMESGDNLSVIAAVSPANPSNTVSVLYRVEESFERTVRASLLRNEHGAGRQYFKAAFPKLPPGSKVEYTVIGENSGRRVPNPCAMTGLTRQFEVQSAFASTSTPDEAYQPNLDEGRLPFSIEYLSHFTIHLGGGPPEIIGETPDGIKGLLKNVLRGPFDETIFWNSRIFKPRTVNQPVFFPAYGFSVVVRGAARLSVVVDLSFRCFAQAVLGDGSRTNKRLR